MDRQEIHLISRKKLEYIAHNHIVSEHAHQRLLERFGDYDLRAMILNSPLAWRNTDGAINIAFNYDNYIVVVEENDCFLVITYKTPSLYGYNVLDKLVLGYMGIGRKNHKGGKSGRFVSRPK